ncbi:MAG: hypothetical protein ABSH20_05135 [Tepidisphaeraceae bacterium]|jgi:hypothetical protein
MLRKLLTTCALLLLVAAFLPGCLEADKSIRVRYDKAADTFHMLVVYQHIRGGDGRKQYDPKADLAHLENLYKNRDHMIFMPTPWLLAMFGENVLIRDADRLASSVPLASATTDIKPEPVPFSLNAITIRPGQFFFREPGNLCYYHAISVPGSLLDQIIEISFGKFIQESLAQQLNSELDRRLKENTKPNWEQFRQGLIAHTCKQLDQNLAGMEAQGDETWEPDAPFATDTLQRILEAAAKKQLVVKRTGAQLSLTIPMTAPDVAEAIKTADEFRKAVAARLTQLKPKDEVNARVARWYQTLLEVPQLSAADKEHLEIRIDIVQLCNAFDSPANPPYTLDEKARARTIEMADLLAAKLPVAKDVTVAQLVADFQAGTLKANPSRDPVKPGEGLVQPDKPQ